MKRFLIVLLALCLMLTSLTGCGSSGGENQSGADDTQQPGTENSEETPDPTDPDDIVNWGILREFTTTTLTGEAVDQSMLADHKLTLVNVWATYCGPCIKEMPDIAKLVDEYADKGVQMVGIVSDVLNADGSLNSDQLKLAEDIAEQTGADNYTHLLPSESLYGLLSQIYAVPTTILVDKNGYHTGGAYVQMLTEDQLRQIIDDALVIVEAREANAAAADGSAEQEVQ